MRLAVLAAPDSWYLQDLQRAAVGRFEIECLPFTRLAAGLGQDGKEHVLCGDRDLTEFDAVLVRTMPPGSLEQVVFRMDVLARLEHCGVTVVNPPKALEAAVDKYLASARLQAAGLAPPPTWICQTVDEAMEGYRQLGRHVVVKPVFGGEGRGILKVEDESLALRVFKTLAQLDAVIYLQRFIAHPGYDIRLLVIGEQVLAMRRRNHEDWRTNVSRGASTETLQVGRQLEEIALAAAHAIGAPIAGVDVLPDEEGNYYVLEVNAVPGWKALGRTIGRDVAGMLLDYIESLHRQRESTFVQPLATL